MTDTPVGATDKIRRAPTRPAPRGSRQSGSGARDWPAPSRRRVRTRSVAPSLDASAHRSRPAWQQTGTSRPGTLLSILDEARDHVLGDLHAVDLSIGSVDRLRNLFIHVDLAWIASSSGTPCFTAVVCMDPSCRLRQEHAANVGGPGLVRSGRSFIHFGQLIGSESDSHRLGRLSAAPGSAASSSTELLDVVPGFSLSCPFGDLILCDWTAVDHLRHGNIVVRR